MSGHRGQEHRADQRFTASIDGGSRLVRRFRSLCERLRWVRSAVFRWCCAAGRAC
ncbi:hypothetical protein ACFFX0_04780 [Citricoccus parietis]|uniref:Uncharacterized protein n=1 Tax=Citricoccus parietis TaxID=592307 RepID=A0ABV5FV27_9MICC